MKGLRINWDIIALWVIIFGIIGYFVYLLTLPIDRLYEWQ